MITEGFLLLFIEKGIFESQKLKLIFWAPMSSLSLMKQNNVSHKDINTLINL